MRVFNADPRFLPALELAREMAQTGRDATAADNTVLLEEADRPLQPDCAEGRERAHQEAE